MLKGMARQKAPIVFKSGEPVSVICVASTFTGVTYANNGGKVQLSSAGAHGLTTSPAVGASVYVSWSGGNGVNGLYKVLSVDSTTAFTIDLTYVVGLGTPSVAVVNAVITAVSISLPVLSPTSKITNHIMTGFVASSALKQIFAYINSTSFYNTSSTITSTHRSLLCDGWFSVKGSLTIVVNGASPNSGSSGLNLTATLPDYSGNIFGIALKISAANEVFTLDAYFIEVFI